MKLIDKDALVAEIEEWLTEVEKLSRSKEARDEYGKGYCNGRKGSYRKILHVINTLEVKEVDLKLTLEDVSMIRQIMFDYNRQVRNEMSIPNDEEYCKEVLKRFKAQKGEKV